jgi:bifunctional enzyme CysN/CysC
MTRYIEFTGGDVEAYLHAQERKDLLRFITCGSVDDGKSTLIGRLLYESKMLFEDQLSALEADSKKLGTQGGNLDFALLVDGLAAEREQGITGHEQYTRNMATGASTAELAIILIDARKGVLTQTRRHTFICTLLGIRNLVVCVNKMDLVNYSRETFEVIEADYRTFAKSVGAENVTVIPASALVGDNIIDRSAKMPWYQGATLMAHLETVPVGVYLDGLPFRLPVQWVSRPNQNFRGFAGTIASGTVKPGDALKVLPSGRASTVARIVTADGDLPAAGTDQAVTITLADEIDVSRGDVLCAAAAPVEVSDQFEVEVLWMGDSDMLPGRPYLIKSGTRSLTGTLDKLKYKVNVNTMEHMAATSLSLNEIGVCALELDGTLSFAPYGENRTLGSFIIIDRFSNSTVGMGLIRFALRRAANIHWQALDVNKASRAALLKQKSAVLWFTGLSGAGKSTIANVVEKKLHALGKLTYILDGDNVRHGLNRDLGFTDVDRVENIRRVAEVAKLMADAGVIVLVSFISPFRAERLMARERIGADDFVEVYIDTPIAEAERRDVKGLYAKARRGELKNFTGISSPYEQPENPELHIQTSSVDSEQAAENIVNYLMGRFAG